jgi:hypothetical protein
MYSSEDDMVLWGSLMAGLDDICFVFDFCYCSFDFVLFVLFVFLCSFFTPPTQFQSYDTCLNRQSIDYFLSMIERYQKVERSSRHPGGKEVSHTLAVELSNLVLQYSQRFAVLFPPII